MVTEKIKQNPIQWLKYKRVPIPTDEEAKCETDDEIMEEFVDYCVIQTFTKAQFAVHSK